LKRPSAGVTVTGLGRRSPNRGVHPKVVQELLGHSTISLTLDTYSHVAPALRAEVAKYMQEMFG